MSPATRRLEIDPELCSGFLPRAPPKACGEHDPDPERRVSAKWQPVFRKAHAQTIELRGHSSAGRALAWHARGRRFDPAWLHHASPFGLRVAQPRKSPKSEAWCPA